MYIYQSYTYLIGWTRHNKWYYGVRYGNKCCPENDLWIKYFTSSKYVKEFRVLHGEPDIIQIRKRFDDYKIAIKWEINVLSKLGVLSNDAWLNRNIRGAIAPMLGQNHPRFRCKTPQHVKDLISTKNTGNTAWNKGTACTEETKQKIKNTISNSRKGNRNPMFGRKHSKETLEKISATVNRKGSMNPMFGKHHSKETKELLSQKNIGENSNQFIGYYVTPWGEFPAADSAALNCPVPVNGWTISKWCRKDNQKIISKKAVAKSKVLTDIDVGKTFYEIGFLFIQRKART